MSKYLAGVLIVLVGIATPAVAAGPVVRLVQANAASVGLYEKFELHPGIQGVRH